MKCFHSIVVATMIVGLATQNSSTDRDRLSKTSVSSQVFTKAANVIGKVNLISENC